MLQKQRRWDSTNCASVAASSGQIEIYVDDGMLGASSRCVVSGAFRLHIAKLARFDAAFS